MFIVKGTIAVLYIAVNTLLCCVPIYLLAIPRALVPVPRVRAIIGSGMTRVIDAWVGGNRLLLRGLSISRVKVVTELDEPLGRDRWYMVISNHQSWSDILVLQDTFLDRIPPLKFFVKQQLIWIPLLGLAMWLLGFPYVRRYSREALAKDPTESILITEGELKAAKGTAEDFPTIGLGGVYNFRASNHGLFFLPELEQIVPRP